MQEFFARLFSENNSDLTIVLYDVWHFLYLFIIFGTCAICVILCRKSSPERKEKLLRFFAYLTIGLYVADFMIMPLSDSYNGISTYKLPFNICTLMAVLVPFAQFNQKFKPMKTTIVVLSIVSSFVWMCYPGSALGGQPPFSYIIFQTFMYHGFLFCWGFLNLALGVVKLDIKKIWRELVGILCMLVWASFGNEIYPGEQNWFFIETSIVPFLEDEIMPVMVVLGSFIACLMVYGAYYGYRAIFCKNEEVEM